MKKIDRLSLDSHEVIELFKEGIEENDEEKVIEMLEEILGRGVLLKPLLDAFYVKIESGGVLVGSRMCNMIAHIILHYTKNAMLRGNAGISEMQNLRKFAEIVSKAETKNDAIFWYKDYFGELYQSGR